MLVPAMGAHAPYWGSVTASVNWCEPDYVYTPYIAEWWNTLTSFPIFALALYGFFVGLRQGYSKRVLAPLLLMAVVGFGSMAFHGTLQKWGQAIDELAMIWAAAALVFAVFEIDVRVQRAWLAPALLLYCAAFSAAYFFLPEYFVWFLLSYIALVLTLFAGSLRFCGKAGDKNARLLLVVSAVLYAGGFFLLWLPDKLMCERVRDWQFHALFVSARPPKEERGDGRPRRKRAPPPPRARTLTPTHPYHARAQHITSTIGPWYLIMHVVYSFHERANAAKLKGYRRPLLVLHAGVLPIVELHVETGRKTPGKGRKTGLE